MAYEKPGIEVSQVQKTNSAILVTPDLEGVVVGNPYWWQDPSWDDASDPLHNSIAPSKFTSDNSPMTINLSDINSTYNNILVGDGALTIVDLLGVSGGNTGKIKHLSYGSDFSVNEVDNTITISGMAESGSTSQYLVKVGYRAAKTDAVGFNVISAPSEISEVLGEAVSWNPLAFGVNIAMENSASAFNALGVAWNASPGTIVADAINDVLSLKDIYVIAPVTHNVTAGALKSHCEEYALPVNKKERIAFANTVISYPDDPRGLTSTERVTVAAAIRDSNTVIGSKRLFSIHPDRAYVLETRHISTIKPSWIESSFSYTTTINFSTYGPYAKFTADTIISGVKYKAGQDITESIWTILMANADSAVGTSGMMTVFAPVPGYYYNAQVAGQVVGTTPEQPITNVAGTGLARTFGSQDIFSETDLNTMASGGTFIMTQDSDSGPIYPRHQMSTDITSVAKRELSVTKAIDYTSKFIRGALKPYIGKYNITPELIELVGAILYGIGKYLVKQGVIADLKVISVTQDSLQQDVLNAEVSILPKYPVNYIKVQLTF